MKIKNVTPPALACPDGACPAIYETDRETYFVIGRKVDLADDLLTGKVGQDEIVIEVPQELLRDLAIKR